MHRFSLRIFTAAYTLPFLLSAFGYAASTASAGGKTSTTNGYQKPPAGIEALLNAAPSPVVHLSPDRATLAIEQPRSFPSIADMAEPRLRLAGVRFNPHRNDLSREVYATSLSLLKINFNDKEEKYATPLAVKGLPASPRLLYLRWSPDSRHLAVVQQEDVAGAGAGLYLYVVDTATAQARRLSSLRLNGLFGDPCTWLPNGEALICRAVPTDRGPEPVRNPVPVGPIVSENLGKVTPGRTFEDLLTNPEDENFFEYYASSQLEVIPLSGPARSLGARGVLTQTTPSPDGNWVLMVERRRPFSYALPYPYFPTRVSAVNLKTRAVKQLFEKPLEDNIPSGFDSVETGPREPEWRLDAAAELVWAEAADGGNARSNVPVHDRLLGLSAPFTAEPSTLLELPLRYAGVEWGSDHLALVMERDRRERKRVILSFDPTTNTARTIYEGSSENRYLDPGKPMLAPDHNGNLVLQVTTDGSGIYFTSSGASPEGDQPFVGIFPRAGGKEKIVWRSKGPFYEEPVALLKEGRILESRESAEVQPNYYVARSDGAEATQITWFPNPYGETKLPTRQLLRYKREDGVDLTANLWLPAGYKKSDGPLPTMMEAYPAEFKSRNAAAQVSGSPYRFLRFGWGGSPVLMTGDGYAVLESASIPIIGEGKQEPNDTYIEQLVAGAKAGVDAGVATGAVDPKRIAVMGHSYGAFMTANLLAHTNLFRAGIARSGAYNRTLTPYGFQNEERTYWQAPEVYYRMSPFSFADKIKVPILLIHGESDDNQGTFPIQSERLFVALKGQGATVRLVFLPLEAHHYDARESVEDMLWEMDSWMNRYVRPAVPVAGSGATAGGEYQ